MDQATLLSGYMLGVVELTLRLGGAALVLLRRSTQPSRAIPWMIVVLALPFIGLAVYLLFGESSFGIARRRRYLKSLDRLRRETSTWVETGPREPMTLDQHDVQVAAAALSLDAAPIRPGNDVGVTCDPDVMDAWFSEAIAAAQSDIDITTYIYEDDRCGRAVAKGLAAAVRRGVRCRLLVDGFGSSRFLRSSLIAQMRSDGIETQVALPGSLLRALFHRIDMRNHRKIVVVDGSLGFTGSRNIVAPEFLAKRAYAPWVDCLLRVRGPAVTDLHRVFAVDWNFETGEVVSIDPARAVAVGECPVQVIPTGPAYDSEAVAQTLHAAVQVARHEIVLTTPYFVPDTAFLRSLAVAARRGVVVHLVMPKRNDSHLVALASRALLGPLLEAGVRIWEFPNGLLHAKTVTVDGVLAIVTSANLDRRSFELNFEVTAAVYDNRATESVRAMQQGWIDASTRYERAEWSGRTNWARFQEGLAGLLAPLL